MSPWLAPADEIARLRDDDGARAALFEEVMLAELKRWIDLADERMAAHGIDVYVMPGNDDPWSCDPVIESAAHVRACDDRIVRVGPHEMISCGYSNPPPWRTPRELSEDALYARIKALADQSKKATTQVRQILGEIQKATNAAVMATEQGTKSVSDAIKTVSEAGTTIRMLADIIGTAAQSAAQIAASSGQQATGMRQIHQAMHNISQVSTQHLAATSQSEQAAKHLTVLGASLKQLVAG